MRKVIPFIFLFLFAGCQGAYETTKTEQPMAEPVTGFDESLAMNLGADEYGLL